MRPADFISWKHKPEMKTLCRDAPDVITGFQRSCFTAKHINKNLLYK